MRFWRRPASRSHRWPLTPWGTALLIATAWLMAGLISLLWTYLNDIS